jgi:hypothetical protein
MVRAQHTLLTVGQALAEHATTRGEFLAVLDETRVGDRGLRGHDPSVSRRRLTGS